MKSDERTVQEQRELSTLMVVYTTTADIPPSPREPSEPFTGDTLMEESFGAPIEQTKVCHHSCNGSAWCSPVN